MRQALCAAMLDAMRLSNTDIYAFKALAFLGMLEPGTIAHGEEIARATNVPKPYLVRLLASLSSQGIVTGRKGAGGGYSLARAPEEIQLTDVLRAIDGPVAALSCSSRNWHKSCPEEVHCHARSHVWIRIRDAILAVLEDTSVADLMVDARHGVDYTHCLEHLLRPMPFGVARGKD
jgi:Rrf2 family transcriptional regulator, cysteine metabolism repressor